jgi:hypothetical protein
MVAAGLCCRQKLDNLRNWLLKWNVMRLARLILGLMAAVQGAILQQTMLAMAGVLVALLAIFNYGCGAASCQVPENKKNTTTIFAKH